MNKYLLMPTLALILGLGVVQAEDANPTNPPAAGENSDQREDRGNRGNRGNWMERMVKDNPELEGVDLQSEEGRQKLGEVMRKRGQERMAEARVQQRDELKQKLGFTEDEYTVIQPYLDKVENLRLQKSLVMPDGVQNAFSGMRRGGNRGNDQGNARPSFDVSGMLLGGQEMDPLAQEVKDATDALKALLDDPQSSEDELATVVARVRKARAALATALQAAREELRSVLTVKQEAMLTQSGLLD